MADQNVAEPAAMSNKATFVAPSANVARIEPILTQAIGIPAHTVISARLRPVGGVRRTPSPTRIPINAA
jgi:hypothetical protein